MFNELLDDNELDNLDPYNSISDRDPLEDISLDGIAAENAAPETAPPVAAPAPPSVKDVIASRKGIALPGAAPPPAAAAPPVDPLMAQYEAKQKELDDFRNQQSDARKALSFGQIAQQAARGPGSPEGATDLYKTLITEGGQDLKSKQEDLDRRQKIMGAIEQRKSRESVAGANRDMRQAILQSTKATQSSRAQDKSDKETTDRFDKLNHQLTEDVASGRTAFGLASRSRQSVENAQALLSGSLDPNDLDNRQVYELSKVLDRILSQGTATVSGTEHLNPDTARSWLAKKMEWVTNERQGAQAGSFVENITHTLEREKAQANKQIKEAQQKLISTSGDLADKNPEKWQRMLRAHHLDVNEEPAQAPPHRGKPGQLVHVKDPETGKMKLFRIGQDGDSLDEAM